MANPGDDSDALEQMVGLGRVSCGWLRQAGVTSATQVRQSGAVQCYLKVLHAGVASPNLNLLWALQGAIDEVHWTLVPPKLRQQLKQELAREQEKINHG